MELENVLLVSTSISSSSVNTSYYERGWFDTGQLASKKQVLHSKAVQFTAGWICVSLVI